MSTNSLDKRPTRELLALFAHVLEELRSRGAVPSSNNPVADYAESLVARALCLTLLPRSNTGCDARDSEGKRYEIKSRRITRHNGSTQLSVIRGLDLCHFDYLVGVLFNEDFSVQRGCLVPHDVVTRLATYRKHVNGWIFFLQPALWNESGVRDVTQVLTEAQDSQAS